MALSTWMKGGARSACHDDRANRQAVPLLSLVSTNRRGPLGLFRQADQRRRHRESFDVPYDYDGWRRDPSGRYCGQTLREIDLIRCSLRALPSVDEYKKLFRTFAKDYETGKAGTDSLQTLPPPATWTAATISCSQLTGFVDKLLTKKSDPRSSISRDHWLLVKYSRHRPDISNRRIKTSGP